MLCDVRPMICPRASFLPSTITSSVLPTASGVILALNFALAFQQDLQALRLLVFGMLSGMEIAGVFGRGEYLKAKTASNWPRAAA